MSTLPPQTNRCAGNTAGLRHINGSEWSQTCNSPPPALSWVLGGTGFARQHTLYFIFYILFIFLWAQALCPFFQCEKLCDVIFLWDIVFIYCILWNSMEWLNLLHRAVQYGCLLSWNSTFGRRETILSLYCILCTAFVLCSVYCVCMSNCTLWFPSVGQ